MVKQLSMPLQLLICLKSCLERESETPHGPGRVKEINMARKWVMRAVFLTSWRLKKPSIAFQFRYPSNLHLAHCLQMIANFFRTESKGKLLICHLHSDQRKTFSIFSRLFPPGGNIIRCFFSCFSVCEGTTHSLKISDKIAENLYANAAMT